MRTPCGSACWPTPCGFVPKGGFSCGFGVGGPQRIRANPSWGGRCLMILMIAAVFAKAGSKREPGHQPRGGLQTLLQQGVERHTASWLQLYEYQVSGLLWRGLNPGACFVAIKETHNEQALKASTDPTCISLCPNSEVCSSSSPALCILKGGSSPEMRPLSFFFYRRPPTFPSTPPCPLPSTTRGFV